MKNILNHLLFVTVLSFTLASCLTDTNDQEYEDYLKELEEYSQKTYDQYLIDSTLIVDYLVANDSVADFNDDYNIFYHIINEGGESKPNSESPISVYYKGMLLDGTVFDTTEEEPAQFYLSQLLSGWKIGVPLIGREGKIVLYLPSYYGYGESEIGDIPANAVLIFEIELVDFWSY